MARLMLSDELWSKLKEIMLHHRIYNKPTLRRVIEGMLYRMRVGCPWRDLPADFGCWNSIYEQSTSALIKRVWEHKNSVIPERFTAQYNVHMLVYYEMHETYMEVASREQRFKNWCRKWKLNLIEKVNPKWNDLYEEICR